jgi:hypothetical protein
MNNFSRILLVIFLVASCSALGMISGGGAVHAQTDTITPGTVQPGGTCITDVDCSGTNFCRSNNAGGLTCQNLGSNAPTNSSQITGGISGQSSGSVVNTSTGGSVQNTTGTTGLINPLNASTLSALLSEVLSYVVTIGSIFLTLMLVVVGFMFVSARGNDEKIRSARSALLWTVVGGLILLGASALAQVITATVQGL